MRNYLKKFSVLLILAGILTGIAACAKSGRTNGDDLKSPIKHYVITRYFANDEGVQEFIDEQKKENTCTDIYLNDDGYIEVEVTAEQRKLWMDRSRKVIESLIAERSLGNEGYTLRVNESADVLMVEGRKNLKIQNLASDMTLILQNAEFYQILNKSEDWSVKVLLYNHDTGAELMKINFPEEDLNVDSQLWD